MLRLLQLLCVAVVIACCGVTAADAAPDALSRSFFDRRVDAVSARALRVAPPQRLVYPIRQRTARVVADFRDVLFFGWAFAQIGAFAWLWSSGRAAWIRDAIRRRVRSRFLVRAGFGAALAVIARLVALPFTFVTHRLELSAGLVGIPVGHWLLGYLGGMVIVVLIAALIVALILELVDRTRLWYLAFISFLFAATFAVVAIEPVTVAPLLAHMRVLPIAAAAPVLATDALSPTRTLTSYTAGIGPFSRIVFGDALLESASPPEVAIAAARESVHVRNNDVAKLTAIGITLFIFCAAVAVLISDRVHFRRDDDAVSRLALVGAMLGIVALFAYPLYNAYARGIDARTGAQMRAEGADPVAAVRLLVRRADHDLLPLCYRRSTNWYFADHVAIGTQIAVARGTADPCPPYARAGR
jgi:Zn-dependent protease with chaperone function